LAPTNDDRRLREASRGVNAFISAAQMKAVQIQRPFGVALKRLSQDTNTSTNPIHEDNAVSIELYYVEQPAPYRGFDRTSSACVARHTGLNQIGLVLIQLVARGNAQNDSLPPGWDVDLFPPKLVRPGDVIEIDGTRYEMILPTLIQSNVRVDNDGFYEVINFAEGRSYVIEARPINDTGQMLNVEFDRRGRRMRDLGPNPSPVPDAPFWTNPAPYKILRQPTPTSAEPFQMPEGTAIDLRASGQSIEIQGADATGFFYNPDSPTDPVNNADTIVIMFTPEGAVERVRFNEKNGGTAVADEIFDGRTVSNLYLLVGRRENAPPPLTSSGTDKTLDPGKYSGSPPTTEQQKQDYKETVNWLRGESRWIVIGSQSGRVVTVENAFVDPPQFFPISEPLDVVRARQIDASREFAREMMQVGGR